MIVTPGQKAYEKQHDQEDEEGEGEGDDDEEESAEMSSQEQAEEKMETNQESWVLCFVSNLLVVAWLPCGGLGHFQDCY